MQKIILKWLLLKIRSWDVEILEKQILPLEKYLKKTCPKLLTELGALLLEVKAKCESTAEALEHAKSIVTCIEKYSKQEIANQEEKSEQAEQNQQDENNQSNSDEENQQPQQENQNEEGENQDDIASASHSDETVETVSELPTTSAV